MLFSEAMSSIDDSINARKLSLKVKMKTANATLRSVNNLFN